MNKDAIALLKQDHQIVEALLEELASSSDRATRRRGELLEEIETEIKVHAQIEEEIFYPAFKEAVKKTEQKLYYEALEEHRAAMFVLKDLLKADAGTPQFPARAKVLKELILHHVEEEEKELFPQAKKSLSREELQELGAQLSERKSELMNKNANGRKARGRSASAHSRNAYA